jgi:hypothetical protein
MATGPAAILPAALNEREAALFLGLSGSSLRKSRMNGERENHLPPPPFIKMGRRVVYLLDDLRAYLEEHRSRSPRSPT